MYSLTKVLTLALLAGGAAGMKPGPQRQLPAPDLPSRVQIEGVIEQVVGVTSATPVPAAIVVSRATVYITPRTVVVSTGGNARAAELKVGKKVTVIGLRHRDGFIVALSIYVF